MVLENTLENPLDCKEIQPVHPKGDQSWVFIGRTDAEAETPVFWPSHALLFPSPPAFNLSQHQGLFQRVSSSHHVGQSIGASISASVLSMNTQD